MPDPTLQLLDPHSLQFPRMAMATFFTSFCSFQALDSTSESTTDDEHVQSGDATPKNSLEAGKAFSSFNGHLFNRTLLRPVAVTFSTAVTALVNSKF